MKFKIKFKAEMNGRIIEGIESEASWFLIDQQGKFYSYGPLKGIISCGDEYLEMEPLIKINDEYLTIKEIEKRIKPKQNSIDNI